MPVKASELKLKKAIAASKAATSKRALFLTDSMHLVPKGSEEPKATFDIAEATVLPDPPSELGDTGKAQYEALMAQQKEGISGSCRLEMHRRRCSKSLC